MQCCNTNSVFLAAKENGALSIVMQLTWVKRPSCHFVHNDVSVKVALVAGIKGSLHTSTFVTP